MDDPAELKYVGQANVAKSRLCADELTELVAEQRSQEKVQPGIMNWNERQLCDVYLFA